MRDAVLPLRLGVVLLLGVVALFLTGAGMSSATYTSRTQDFGTVRSAADWTPPTVSLTNPGSPVKDTVILAAQAGDAESGVASVRFEHLPPGGTGWATLCTDTAVPFTCAWATKDTADGSHALRAVATDGSGLVTVSDIVTTIVANNLLVVLDTPGDVVRGTVSLPVTVLNPGLLTWSVRVEYVVSGSTNWRTLCTTIAPPYGCSWQTAGVANGDYELRAVALSGASSYYSTVREVTVDNAAPTVTMTDPGAPLRGTVLLGATATDAHSEIAEVVIARAPSGTGTWTSLCTTTTEPYRCSFDTTTVTDGSWSFRAVATDVAGNTTTSAVVANRVVDNTVSSVSMEDPGAVLTGSVTLRASANSTAGVSKVTLQRAPTGTTAWTDVCTVTASPASCAWNTTQVPDGLYDLRAVLTDGGGGTSISTVVAARKVDNAPLRGTDIQAVDGSGTPGRLSPTDTLTLTFSNEVQLATVSPGWTGTPLAVTLRLRDGGLSGLGSTTDTVDLLRTGSVVNLGSMNLRDDYIKTGKTAVFNATMSATTITVNGAQRTRVTVTLGTLASGNGLRTVNRTPSMVWTPSASVLGLTGTPCSTAPVTEPGATDRDF